MVKRTHPAEVEGKRELSSCTSLERAESKSEEKKNTNEDVSGNSKATTFWKKNRKKYPADHTTMKLLWVKREPKENFNDTPTERSSRIKKSPRRKKRPNDVASSDLSQSGKGKKSSPYREGSKKGVNATEEGT